MSGFYCTDEEVKTFIIAHSLFVVIPEEKFKMIHKSSVPSCRTKRL